MMREAPSLETLWLKNIGTMEKVQKIDRSKVKEDFAPVILKKATKIQPPLSSQVTFLRDPKFIGLPNTHTFYAKLGNNDLPNPHQHHCMDHQQL
jgi:hypothetical protein